MRLTWDTFEFVANNAEALAYHPLRHFFVAFSFGQKEALQYQSLLVEKLRTKVVHLASDRCGTVIVRDALDTLHLDHKVMVVENLLCAINAGGKPSRIEEIRSHHETLISPTQS